MKNRQEKMSLIETMKAPKEALDEYPDECANCGSEPDPIWVPNDYHLRADSPIGLCGNCMHHFGTGEEVQL